MPRARSPMDSFHARRAPPLSPSTMPYETATTTRSCSPLHFLNPAAMVYGATITTKATTSSSNSKRRRHSADVSRLLDPSYLPSSMAAKTARSASVSAYVDPAGDLHDPDYRHFPVALPAHSHAHHHNHSAYNYNHSAHHYNHHSGHQSSGYAYTHAGTRRPTSPARPHFDWELAVDESALDDEYPEDEEDLLAHAHSYQSHHHQSQSQYPSHQYRGAPMNARRSSVSTTATMRTGYGGCYSPTGTASTLPTSCEDDGASPFEAEAEKVMVKESEKELKENEKEKEVKDKRRRRLSKGDKEKEKARAKDAARMRDAEKAFIRRVSFDEDNTAPLNDDAHTHEEQRDEERDEDEDEEDDEEDAEARRVLREQGTYVPSCGESLRREWQAFALRVRFGVFRARRRVARRVQALLS
ncbi:hypothetical protein BJ912DRAFT_1046069 [Pholiota molesta]|nr:hypothetical protein BJ912DRAFT_1046069 [Pholiota molesta]